MIPKSLHPKTVASLSHLIRSNGRTSLLTISLGCGIALVGGFLSRVAANPGTGERLESNRTGASTASPDGRGSRPSSWNWTMQQSDILGSHKWLNGKDQFPREQGSHQQDPQDLRTYAPIFSAQAPDDTALFPDAGLALALEPDLLGLALSEDALRSPWNGRKEPDQYRQDSEERLSKSRYNWTQYLASYRTIAGALGADNAPYPTAPQVLREPRVEFGSEHTLYPGRYAYAPDSPGNVSVRDRTVGRDASYPQSVMQRAQIASWAEDKMATQFLSPVYGLGHYALDENHEAASRLGNEAAAPYERLIPQSSSSRERGNLWRKAARIYHTVYHAMQQE